MGFFGPTRKRGVTPDELKHDESRVRSIFGFSSTGKRKADEVVRLIETHLDPEYGGQGRKVMTKEELDESLEALRKDKVISPRDAERIKQVFERDMRD